jgi:hypothetical protein
MENIELKLTFRDFFGYVLAYFLWLAAAAMGMMAILEARNALNAMWPVLGSGNQWTWALRPVDRFGLVFLGLVGLVYAIFCEHHYRTAITAVRVRAYKGRQAPALENEKASWASRYLARMGLDILAPRFATTIVPPIAVWLVSFLIKELAFRLMVR